MLFKIKHDIKIYEIKSSFVITPVKVTRRNSYKLVKECSKQDVRKYFFALRFNKAVIPETKVLVSRCL